MTGKKRAAVISRKAKARLSKLKVALDQLDEVREQVSKRTDVSGLLVEKLDGLKSEFETEVVEAIREG
jgi:hypothetical protein